MVILLGLWETVVMKKPHVQVTEWAGTIPTKAICSSCSDTTFTALEKGLGSKPRTAEDNERLLNTMFEEHFKKKHLHEDASQAAARS